MKNINKAIKLTTRWLEDTIIGLNFCPFAQSPYQKGLVRISNSQAISDEQRLDFFIDEVALIELNLRSDIATTLVVFSNSNESFVDFNDFCGLCEDYLIDSHLDSDLQVVVFHPDFYFKDSDECDPTNLVGQSPFPTIHIIRNIYIDQATDRYPDIDQIPEQNRQKIIDLKLEVKPKRRIK